MTSSESQSVIPLGDLILKIESGKSIQTTEQLAKAEQLGVLKVSALSWGYFNPREAKAVLPGYTPEEHHRVRDGDVLISRANTVELVGAVVRVRDDYPNRLLSDKSLRLILDESRCDPDYIVQMLRLPAARHHIEENATGTSDSMRNISQDTICATPIVLRPLEEQRKIARKVHEIERQMATLLETVQNQLADIKVLQGKLLSQVFDA